jgi:hypothetical protein
VKRLDDWFPAAAHVIAPVMDLRILFSMIIPRSDWLSVTPVYPVCAWKSMWVDAIGQEETCRLRDSRYPHCDMNATKGLSPSCDRIDFDERDAVFS